jgi:hypothetical protein
MSVSTQQRQFNKYPIAKPINLDSWYGCSKEDKRNSAIALIYSFLLEGGQIKVAPTKKRKDSIPQIFQKDTRATKEHEKWNRKFYSGDDFTQKGPRFTSKPISERAADQRDLVRKAGISHATFSGAVVDINGKLQARKASHTTTEYLIDLVSHNALRASAKRDGGKLAQKIVKLVEDGHDDVTDAYRSATIADELNYLNVDHDHNAKLKLAA